jgi:hypothetical protein
MKNKNRVETRDHAPTKAEMADHIKRLAKVIENGGYYIICPKDKKGGTEMQGVCIIRELSKADVMNSVMEGVRVEKETLIAYMLRE